MVVLLSFGFGAAALIGLMLWPFLPALVTSGVLGILAFPAHRWVRARIPQDQIAALVSTLGIVVVILLPIVLLSMVALRDLASSVEWLEGQIRAGFPMFGEVAARVDGLLAALGFGGTSLSEAIANRLQQFPDLVLGRTFSLVSGLGGVALQAGVGLFTLFYLLQDGDRMLQAAKSHVPLASGPTELLAKRSYEVIFAAVYGHVFVALVQGLLGGVIFWALGIPTPIVWGALMAALSMIPMVGPAFVWAPAGIVLIATGSTVRGVVLLLLGVLLISTVDNVIRAILVSARARVHPLVVFFGVLGGVLTFGVVGILVGPVLIVVAGALMEMARMSLFPEEGITRAAPASPAAPGEGAAPPIGGQPAGPTPGAPED